MQPDEYPLTPLEAAHNLLAARMHFSDTLSYRRFLTYVFRKPHPYLDKVREMVYAELPFWDLLDELPPQIPLPDEN